MAGGCDMHFFISQKWMLDAMSRIRLHAIIVPQSLPGGWNGLLATMAGCTAWLAGKSLPENKMKRAYFRRNSAGGCIRAE